MILAQNWPKTAKFSWQCPFKNETNLYAHQPLKVYFQELTKQHEIFKLNILSLNKNTINFLTKDKLTYDIK